MRYLLVGCGAIGGTVAAGLARDGHEILVCDADPAIVTAVSGRGLSIEGPVEQYTARLPAVLPAGLPARIDGPVLLAVKSHHTAAAMAALAGRLGPDGYVVSLQNGLNTQVIADAVGTDRVVEAFVNFGADMTEPGVVLRGNRATFVIGEPDGRLSDRVAALTADIADAEPTTSVLGYLWAKQAYGTQLFATAVSDLPIYAVFEDPAYRDLLLELARQVLAQAPVTPMPFDGFDPADLAGSLARLAAFNRGSAKTHSGVYRDLAILHRPTEAPAILGPMTGPLVRRVAELVAAIEQGRRRCTRANLDLLAAYERLERLGRPVNAVVSVLGDPARAHEGEPGPVWDRPVAVKDIVAVTGMPTRCGSPASDPAPAAFDAELVARLRAAGAEVFATTQCLEYAAGFAHPAVGDTRNPRDPSRTSGGSSGGSAAVVAAGVCDLAIGTDTGGSIRIPAAYCGIVGLKPSYGLIPLDGVFPLAPSCDHAGTLTATVAGTADLLAVLADPGALTGARASAAPPVAFTLGVLAGQLTDPSVTPEVHAAVTGALGALAAAGWDLREVTAPWLDDLPEWERVLSVIVAREAHQVHHLRDTGGYAEGTRALLEFGAAVTQEEYAAALVRRDELIAAVNASMAGLDALAGPTVGFVAPEQDPPFGVGEDSGEGRFTGPYNLTGQPAIAIPVPAAGLPASLQLAGRLGGDADLLRVAVAAEALLSSPTESELAMPTTVTRRHLNLAGLDVPVVELAGANDGPLLTVIAGVHGCEYVPMAAVREWTRDLEQREISGRIRAVPVLNVTAFRARSPFVVPEDGKNLNRCFPGDPAGTLAPRLAHAAFTELITGSDAYIDAHCGDMVEALEPFALYEAGPAEAAARELALAYGLGYVIRQEAGPDRAVSGTSSGAAAQAGIPGITAEAGGCGLVERHAVDAHLRGLNAVLAHLGMTAPADAAPAGRPEPTLLDRFLWLRCARAGWWAPTVAAGDRVTEGQVLGTVSSLDGSVEQEAITAPADGVIIFLTSSPAVADDGLLLGLGAQ